MISDNTRSAIDEWVGTNYGAAAPVRAAASAPAQATGLLSMAQAQPTGYAPAPSAQPVQSTQTPTFTPSIAQTSAWSAPSTQFAAPASAPTSTWQKAAATTLNQSDLALRNVDESTETVRGQLQTVLDENGPLAQQARADAMRAANDRGMLNSTMAASGGTDALIRSSLSIATPDAAAYGKAADYNAAVKNQALMYNADQQNATSQFNSGQQAEQDARAQQLYVAQQQLASDEAARNQQARTQQAQLDADKIAREQQLFVAQMQDQTSRYNTDANFRQQADETRKSLANNIIQNMDISPDRKAAMLESLGEGTSAGTNPDGTYRPGTGLAGAVYVIDSVAADLQYSPSAGAGGVGGAINGAWGAAYTGYEQNPG